MSGFVRISIHFVVIFLRFLMLVSQSKPAQFMLTPNLGILWILMCSFWLCGSIVANPIIYRLIPTIVLHEVKSGNSDRSFVSSHLKWRRAHVTAGWLCMNPNVNVSVSGVGSMNNKKRYNRLFQLQVCHKNNSNSTLRTPFYPPISYPGIRTLIMKITISSLKKVLLTTNSLAKLLSDSLLLDSLSLDTFKDVITCRACFIVFAGGLIMFTPPLTVFLFKLSPFS